MCVCIQHPLYITLLAAKQTEIYGSIVVYFRSIFEHQCAVYSWPCRL